MVNTTVACFLLFLSTFSGYFFASFIWACKKIGWCLVVYQIASVGVIVGAGLYILNCAYWFTVRLRARNAGFFRDDRRDNDSR
jgi:hypothetical protein